MKLKAGEYWKEGDCPYKVIDVDYKRNEVTIHFSDESTTSTYTFIECSKDVQITEDEFLLASIQ
tara:strand:+ start:9774 stop:9965 length:192 start_codon:yes stop_codon:yes gene_type:complete